MQANCEINKVNEQMNQAYKKNDQKRVDELSQKIERLEKILGPEYVALMDGLQKLGPENSKRVAEILLQFAGLDRLCTK
jgi:spore coat polysaccharide biosynthesis predicted glycosyltransferase SpsG